MNELFQARLVSSLEKGLITDRPEDYPALTALTALRGERVNFQLFFRYEPTGTFCTRYTNVTIEGLPEGAAAPIRAVRHVAADLPTFGPDPSVGTPGFIESPTGLYPDLLEPLYQGKNFRQREGQLGALWFEATCGEAGTYPVTVTIWEGDSFVDSQTLTLTVIDAVLPEQSTVYTQWFHADCLAVYYRVEPFSEAHWEILEKAIRFAARHGINCLLTPIFTPPLDTEIGGERPTVQLVGVEKTGDGYRFDFTLLKRWIDLSHACGITHFEMAHLFTQWGAAFAPKVMAKVDGRLTRIFGWDTPASEGEYPRFLAAFLPELTAFLRAEGILHRCLFHVSDEPNGEQLENYRKARDVVEPYLAGCTMIDALSSVEYYRRGLVRTPIPATDAIEPFLAEDIAWRWTYYCCGQYDKVGNRFIAYPGFRNRILGVQLYKFGITGFLQWGHNFYFSMGSRRLINPYLCQSGEGLVPSGDAFSVYPGADGAPLATPRLAVFHEALQDIEALKCAEKKIGREAVIALIDGLAGSPVTFASYPQDNAYLLTLREAINRAIAGTP